MSQIRKHTWKGLAVVAAMLLSVGLMTQTVFAAVSTTTGANTLINLSTNAATGSNTFSTLTADAVISGSAAADFPAASTITLTAPTGWNFNTAAVLAAPVIGGGGTLVLGAATITATTIQYTITTAASVANTITFDTNGPLLIKPLTASSQAGFVTASISAPAVTGNIAFISVGPVGTTTSIIISQIPAGSVTSDGTTNVQLKFNPVDVTGTTILGLNVSVTASRGTLSATSSTTSTSACAVSAAGGCTLTFRGNGTTGTANITATTASPNEAIGLYAVQVVAPTTNPTGIKHFSTNNSGHVAASTQSVYTSPTIGARVRFQVTSGTSGVNNELVQVTVDKGYIVQGDTTVNGTLAGSCAGNNTTASDTSHGPVTIDGTDYDGIVEFTVCAQAGVVGPIKVTAKDLSTTLTDATTTLTSAGVPNKLTSTATGGAVTVTITDKDGNEVAEGTTVLFSVPAFTGTVAPACTTTTNGKASAAAAFSGTGGQVLITVFINDTGNTPASTCAALGSSAAVAQTVNLGSGVTPPATGGGSGFIGTAPAKGSIALLVTAGPTNAASLVSAFAAAGCTVESLAILEGGVWKIYINGAPAVVNSAFPTALPGTLAFFVRCQA